MATPNQTWKRGKKLTLSIKKMEAGESFKALYIGHTTKDWTDDATGEVRPLVTRIFQDLESPTEDRFGVFEDAGLKNALENAMVKEGSKIEVVKLPKIELKGGRTCNQYDVFSLE